MSRVFRRRSREFRHGIGGFGEVASNSIKARTLVRRSARLKDALERLPIYIDSRIEELLPHRWQPVAWEPARGAATFVLKRLSRRREWPRS